MPNIQRWMWLTIVATLYLSPATTQADTPDWPRIRSSDAVVLETLAIGQSRSGTFRALMKRLGRSDLIVHIDRRETRTRPLAVTRFIAATKHARYLRITLDVNRAGDASISLLGHELRHAVELAEAPWVSDEATYRLLYERIGHASCGAPSWCFDTPAAVAAGYQVLAELRGGRKEEAE